MRTWILRILPKLIRRTRCSTSTYRPTLEQLEDRCVPSASMMPSMGMTMQPMMNMQPASMQTMNMPSMGTNTMSTNMMGANMMNNGLSPSTMAALFHLFTDFNQTRQEVLNSQSFAQLFANEVHMIMVLRADIAQLDATLNGMG